MENSGTLSLARDNTHLSSPVSSTETGSKHCPTCGIVKPVSSFHQDSKTSDRCFYCCKSCANMQRRHRYLTTRERERDYAKEYAKRDPKSRAARQHRYYMATTGVLDKTSDAYQMRLQQARDWSRLNVAIMNAKTRRRQLRLRTATLTDKHRDAIQRVYEHARDCSVITGEPYHVDHIIPINGETVCGLHVPWNLQILPAAINLRKSNKLADHTGW